jgi:hypothetical protein
MGRHIPEVVMSFRVREPRQPQIHKGFVVHTDESPDYDDSATTQAINDTISAANQPTKETDMPRKNGTGNLPNGRQGKDIAHAITTYCEVGQMFKAEQVWSWLGQRKQTDWIEAYGGRDKAFSKVKVALNNLNYSGRLGLERSTTKAGVFQYTGKRGEPSDAYKRTIATRNKRKAKQGKDIVDKSASKPVAHVKTTRAKEFEGYRDVGVDHDGVPLYIERKTGRVGHVKVVVQFIAI